MRCQDGEWQKGDHGWCRVALDGASPPLMTAPSPSMHTRAMITRGPLPHNLKQRLSPIPATLLFNKCSLNFLQVAALAVVSILGLRAAWNCCEQGRQRDRA